MKNAFDDIPEKRLSQLKDMSTEASNIEKQADKIFKKWN
jgi:hypothetical protein